MMLYSTITVSAGQDPDSLKALLNEAAKDSNRVHLLGELANAVVLEDLQAAKGYASEGLLLAEQLNWQPGVAELSSIIGAIHVEKGDYEEGLTYLQRSLNLSDSLGDRSRMAHLLRNIGTTHRRIGNMEKALEYTMQSLDLCREIGDSSNTAKALLNVGNISIFLDKFDKALDAFGESMVIFESLKYPKGTSYALNGLGNTSVELKKYGQALSYYNRSLEVVKRLGDIRAQSAVHINISDIHSIRGNYRLSIEHLNLSLDLAAAGGAGAWLVQEAYLGLVQAYAGVGNYKQSYEYKTQYINIKDSLLNAEHLRQINEIRAKYEAEKREQHIALLEKDKELQASQLDREILLRNIIIAGLLVVIVFAVGIFRQARYRKKSNEQLTSTLEELRKTQDQLVHTEKMATLGRLSAGIAHEIKNPLNFINNFAQLSESLVRDLEKADIRDESPRSDFSELRNNIVKIGEYGEKADGIVSNMLQHAGGKPGEVQETDLNLLLSR